MSVTGQLALFEPTPEPADVWWMNPVDRYGRPLPPIAIFGDDWKAIGTWGPIAIAAADKLGPDATAEQLYQATTTARHLFYAMTGDRARLDLELARYREG